MPTLSPLLAALLAIGLLTPGHAAHAAAEPPAAVAPAFRPLTSLQFSREMGLGWNLGNSLEAIGGETAWGNPPASPMLFRAIRAAGFTTLRLPVAWAIHADGQDRIDAAWMSRVAQVVADARAAGLTVVLNMHWDGGWMQPTAARQATVNRRLATFWRQIAERFKDEDEHLLFAGTNEVMVEGDWGPPKPENVAAQNSFNQTFVDTVRASGGFNRQRHLVVQGFNTDVGHTLAHFVLPQDPTPSRLMVEVHYYDPYEFTLDEKSKVWQWGAGATDPQAKAAWGDEPHVDAQFAKLQARFIAQGVPVLLGEYAALRRDRLPGQAPYRAQWTRYVTRSAQAHGLVPVYWDSGATGENASGLFDRASGRVAVPEVLEAITRRAR